MMERYTLVHLPGAGGSIGVVHLKWSACPAGAYNLCKGKEDYPTLAFEVISGFDREILGVSSVQFGTRNDKHIVKLDKNVTKIRDEWYNTVQWNFYDQDGTLKTAVGCTSSAMVDTYAGPFLSALTKVPTLPVPRVTFRLTSRA